MFGMEIYTTVRQLVLLQGLSRRDVAARLGISRDAVAKMCRYEEPPGYVRTKPVPLTKLGPVVGGIEAILDADETAPAKQRHTAPMPSLSSSASPCSIPTNATACRKTSPRSPRRHRPA
jgi:hypothetical protein